MPGWEAFNAGSDNSVITILSLVESIESGPDWCSKR